MTLDLDLDLKVLTQNRGFFNALKEAIESPYCQYSEGITLMPANKSLRKRINQYKKEGWKFVEIVKRTTNRQYIAIKGKNIEQIKMLIERANFILNG